MKLYYTERAKEDVELAVKWYEKQQNGLGIEFLSSIETALKNIIEHPEIFPIRYDCFRGCPIKRFPFSIFYSVEMGIIVLHSVFDNRQDPDRKP